MNIKNTMSGLSTFALVMLITGAVDSIRNLPSAALFGSSLVFFFIFSAIVFLIPTALVSAELTSSWTEKGGICYWIKLAFGDNWAFLAIWLQWIANLVWFPTILSFIAGVIAYLIDPALAQNKFYLVTVILITFWTLTWINLKGLIVSSRFVSFCTIVGMVIPMALIIALAVSWILSGHPLQIELSLSSIIPSFSKIDNWVSLTAIMTAFAGMELAAVHIKDIKNPQKTFPKALAISVWLILITMTLGSLAIAIVLPKNSINLVNGIMQAFTEFFDVYQMRWMMPIIALMVLIGTVGGIISWVISPVKGLLQAAQLGFLPDSFKKENKNGVASNLLIGQAILVSIICFAFLFMPSVSASYWLLTALNIQIYMLMYVLMFLAAIRLRYKYPNQIRLFAIPGGKIGLWLVSLLGLIGCGITLFVGFLPPEGINIGNIFHYEIIFCSGLVMMVLPTVFFFYYKNKKSTLSNHNKMPEVISPSTAN